MAIERPPQINMFEGAIPGQSMTASPDSKMPWDGPPQYAGLKEATEAMFLDLLISNCRIVKQRCSCFRNNVCFINDWLFKR